MSKKKIDKLDIDKQVMYNEMVMSMWQGEPTRKLVQMFYDMSQKLADLFKYVIEEDRNDVVSFAMEGLLTRYYKFNFNRKNPFSYYTTTITNLIINSYPQLERDGVSLDAIYNGDTEQ